MLPLSFEKPSTPSLLEPTLSQLDKEELFSSTTEWQRGSSLVGEVETLFLSKLHLLGDLPLPTLRSGGKGIEVAQRWWQ